MAIDYEIANINVSAEDTTNKKPSADDGKPIFAWHYDSFPFVCVTMLSDCTGMVGGETAIRTGDGSIKKVRGPSMVREILLFPREIWKTPLTLIQKGHRSSHARPIP